MALTEFLKAQVIKKLDEYCDQIPEHIRCQLKYSYSIRGNDVTMFEERLRHDDKWSKMPVAKLKYDELKNSWSLWWADSKDRWYDYYKEIKRSVNPGTLDAIVEEVNKDPKCIFFS